MNQRDLATFGDELSRDAYTAQDISDGDGRAQLVSQIHGEIAYYRTNTQIGDFLQKYDVVHLLTSGDSDLLRKREAELEAEAKDIAPLLKPGNEKDPQVELYIGNVLQFLEACMDERQNILKHRDSMNADMGDEKRDPVDENPEDDEGAGSEGTLEEFYDADVGAAASEAPPSQEDLRIIARRAIV